MSWALGYDDKWNRDIGYGVPAYCDHPGCEQEINRGLSHVCCGARPYGGDNGCGRYYCSEHQSVWWNDDEEEVCAHPNDDYVSEDHPEWVEWKMTDPSWEQWRKENGYTDAASPHC